MCKISSTFQISALLIVCGTLAACAPAVPTATNVEPIVTIQEGRRTLTVMTHVSFAISEPVLQAFIDQYGSEVKFLKTGDTGTAVNKAILAKNAPLADVFYGVDNTFLSRALDEGIFEPNDSPQLADLPHEFKLDPQHRALPVDFGDVCLNYDKAYFAETGLAPPVSLEDLIRPKYKGL